MKIAVMLQWKPDLYDDKPDLYDDKPELYDDKPDLYDITDLYDDITDLYDDMTDLYAYPWHVWMLVLWGVIIDSIPIVSQNGPYQICNECSISVCAW